MYFTGEEATRMIIEEGRKVAEGLEGAKKADLLRNCDEAEILCNQLSDLCRRGLVNMHLHLTDSECES